MNNQTYKKLSNLQADLDNYIAAEKQIYMPDYKLERIIALSVEFHELLNEVRFIFKYWSYKQMDRGKALGEYVDGIHFLLSLGLTLGFESYTPKLFHPKTENLIEQFLTVYQCLARLHAERSAESHAALFSEYLALGALLGFTGQEIESAYLEKNLVNHERQDKGY